MTHRWTVRVYYEDVDLAGIVYHANHLRYIERARSEMVRDAGVDQAAMRAGDRMFVVTRIVADYLGPARYDDRLEIATDVASLGRARLVLEQVVSRDATMLFRATVTIACMDGVGRPRRLPDALASLVPR